jgi:hypothetical protein
VRPEERTHRDGANPRARGAARDAAFWAKRVGRLEVSDVPEGVVNLNVQGRREVGALQGFGKLWQKTYGVCLEGAAATPVGVVEAWKENFDKFWPRVSYNALVRSALHAMMAPPRRIKRSNKRLQATGLRHQPENLKPDARSLPKGGTS